MRILPTSFSLGICHSEVNFVCFSGNYSLEFNGVMHTITAFIILFSVDRFPTITLLWWGTSLPQEFAILMYRMSKLKFCVNYKIVNGTQECFCKTNSISYIVPITITFVVNAENYLVFKSWRILTFFSLLENFFSLLENAVSFVQNLL